ncbi:hypothetical protein BC629DRAFT_806667 [Irpex lacteus]|nr:hypothetical protein BC629DRAFT_806667 [Irpex lacteus]
MQRNTKKRRTMASLEVSQLASAVDGDSATDVSFTRVRTVRGRRATLQQIVEMPMDVIYEICFHLQPKDLLNLARSSKNLRSIFMSRSMRHVWRATGRNVSGLPPCPRDLNEPSYASLLFDTSCSNCMRKNCGRVYWRCRVRLCNYCLRAQSVEKLEAWNMLSLDARALVGYAGFIDSYICPLEIRARHSKCLTWRPLLP